MGNEDMGGGLYFVVRAVSTNDVWSCIEQQNQHTHL